MSSSVNASTIINSPIGSYTQSDFIISMGLTYDDLLYLVDYYTGPLTDSMAAFSAVCDALLGFGVMTNAQKHQNRQRSSHHHQPPHQQQPSNQPQQQHLSSQSQHTDHNNNHTTNQVSKNEIVTGRSTIITTTITTTTTTTITTTASRDGDDRLRVVVKDNAKVMGDDGGNGEADRWSIDNASSSSQPKHNFISPLSPSSAFATSSSSSSPSRKQYHYPSPPSEQQQQQGQGQGQDNTTLHNGDIEPSFHLDNNNDNNNNSNSNNNSNGGNSTNHHTSTSNHDARSTNTINELPYGSDDNADEDCLDLPIRNPGGLLSTLTLTLTLILIT